MKFIYSKNSVYSNRVFLYKYTDNLYKLVSIKNCREKGFEEVLTKPKKTAINKEEVERVSLARTKKNIRELALCNEFEYFVTLTVADKQIRYDLEYAQSRLRELFHKYKRKYKDFKFIIITEKHKDGAFHFHGLVKGMHDLYVNKYGYYNSKMFDELRS